ncbi:hypothetical protein KFE25_011195 [Diacronema lutheri]|uniref:PDZ domain-containing protein n=1 Tax=Diacronema lutheri TaxID=2081491 RepID=A0A8J5XFP2_DIALT|nr:hypothetical protein KFE25_011195 [Diacronema lutheri]
MALLQEADERWIVREREDGTNVNGWHWTNKDLTARGTSALKSALEALNLVQPLGGASAPVASAGACEAPLLRVQLAKVTVTGSVEALNRKGRRFLIYELDIAAEWTATLEDAQPEAVAAASAPAGAVAAAAGEDDEAMARRLQAEEDAASAAALAGTASRRAGTRPGAVRGRVSISEWAQDEEDEPNFACERTAAEPFAREGGGAVIVGADAVYVEARALLLPALKAALKSWARRVRDEGTGPAVGAVPTAAAVPPKPSAPPTAAPVAPAPPAHARAVAVAHDAPEALRDALAAYCARPPAARRELSLRGLQLGTGEVPLLAAFLNSGGAAGGALAVLDASANELGDDGCDALAGALEQGGAPCLEEVRLGANGATPSCVERVTARLRAARPRLAVSWAAGTAGATAAAVAARAICSVGTVHDGSPAAEAGLREGDRLLRAGGIDGSCFVSIEESLVPLIRAHRDKPLEVDVLRATAGSALPSRLRLSLLPHEWSGNGLLGCVLHPVI